MRGDHRKVSAEVTHRRPAKPSRWRWCAFFVVVFLFATGPAAGQGGPGGFVFTENEELVYNVRYAFFNLGQIRITTYGTSTIDGRPVSFARALIDSYRGIPFVDLHAVFESFIDHSMCSRRFMGKIKQDGSWDFSRYQFEYDRNRVIVEMGRQDTVVAQRETVEVRSPYQDGLSLFFLARDGLFGTSSVHVPTMIKEKRVNTTIIFGNRRNSVEIDAFDYPINVVEFDGTMEFTGIFGLTGDFEGWFSNDDARVPIKAKMKVLIGSVTVELMEYKRPGWAPPRAPD